MGLFHDQQNPINNSGNPYFCALSRINDIEQQILTILAENKERMDNALKDPTYSSDPAKLTILMNQNIASLSQVYMLNQEKIVLMIQENQRLHNQN